MNAQLDFEKHMEGFIKYKVYPDIAMFGKAMGNGYAINAIIGKKIMKGAEKTFISSTFWTEAVGSTAALQTIEEIRRLQSWKNYYVGKYIKKNWLKLSNKYNLDLKLQDWTRPKI